MVKNAKKYIDPKKLIKIQESVRAAYDYCCKIRNIPPQYNLYEKLVELAIRTRLVKDLSKKMLS